MVELLFVSKALYSASVSYTHLDVYKRQVLANLENASNGSVGSAFVMSFLYHMF